MNNMSGVYLLSEINEYGASDRDCKDETDFKKNRMNEDCLILYKVVCESSWTVSFSVDMVRILDLLE